MWISYHFATYFLHCQKPTFWKNLQVLQCNTICFHEFGFSVETCQEFLTGASFMVTSKWQLYVATCSPARDVAAGYVAWGHSTLVGPVSNFIISSFYWSISATKPFTKKTIWVTVWRSSGHYWAWGGHNYSRDWLFTTWSEKVMCLPILQIPIVSRCYRLIFVCCFSLYIIVLCQKHSGQTSPWQSNEEVIFTSWWMFRDWKVTLNNRWKTATETEKWALVIIKRLLKQMKVPGTSYLVETIGGLTSSMSSLKLYWRKVTTGSSK
jgi:hypothetical protein